MSRRSQMFSEGVQKFSLDVNRTPSGGYKATCRNYPHISAEGPNEQSAIAKCKEQLTIASEKAELGTDPR